MIPRLMSDGVWNLEAWYLEPRHGGNVVTRQRGAIAFR